jgi:Tubulin domain
MNCEFPASGRKLQRAILGMCAEEGNSCTWQPCSASAQVQVEIEDQLRWFAEECDCLEGFQLLADDSDHWAGVSCTAADVIRDEYSKNALLLFGTQDPSAAASAADQKGSDEVVLGLTRAIATARWAQSCSLRVPMHSGKRGPRLLYDAARPFHASAAMAAAIDTATLPYRLHPTAPASDRVPPGTPGPPSQGACSMVDICSSLSFPGANMAALGTIMPTVSVPCASAPQADTRMSARERRLRGLSAADAAKAPAELVTGGLQWFATGWNPLEGAHGTRTMLVQNLLT